MQPMLLLMNASTPYVITGTWAAPDREKGRCLCLVWRVNGLQGCENRETPEEKGMKKTWLAERLGKSYNMVNSYVQNRQQPRLEVLYEIAKIWI